MGLNLLEVNHKTKWNFRKTEENVQRTVLPPPFP
jgi:hypothetical protein